MERHFDEELQNLREQLLRMASLVEEAIAKAIQSLVDRDGELAQEVIDHDEEIDALEMAIDDLCLRLFALRQPMASDLRFITGAIKINNDLERVGDHAVNIAQRALQLVQEPPLQPLVDIPRMAQLAQSMVKDSLDAFVDGDAAKARSVCPRDDEVDQLEDHLIRVLLTYMMSDPRTISRALDLIIIAKNLERIADLSTNIAEDVIFIVQAKSIKHHAEERSGAL